MKNWEPIFWSRVAKTDDCWLWTGKLSNDGYGYFMCPYRKRTINAHRVAYELAHGVVPKGFVVDHKCRNRACVRPDHCRAVTPRVNVLENSVSVGAINIAKTTCLRGHALVHRVECGRKRRICLACAAAKSRRRRAEAKLRLSQETLRATVELRP